MKKITFLFALLCASVMGFAKQYCGESLTLSGGAEIQLSCIAVSEGNYQIIIEGQNLNGLGGSFFNPGTVDLRTTITTSTSTKIVCEIAAASAPSLYTPLYVMCPGEQNIGWPSDIEWASACSGGSDSGTGGGSTPEPAANSYTAGGHTVTLEAYYVNDIYTLNITSADAMEGLGGSFWNVSGVGTDMRSNSGTNSYTVSSDKKTITCQVQSNSAPNIYTPLYVLMPGEVNFGSVTLNWEDRTPINSEYCNTVMLSGDNREAAFTWETNEQGSILITITETLGGAADATHFRGNGINIDKIKVGANKEDAANYFNLACGGSAQITLSLKDANNAPAKGTKIYVENKVIEYATSKDGNAWPSLTFEYTYGGICNQLDAPINIAIDADSVITFDAVAGAEKYTAYVYLGGVEKYSQEVASGDVLHFWPLVSGDYTVNVIASGEGKTDSDPSADYVWSLEERTIVLGNSEYCEHPFGSGNAAAAITWQTNDAGAIVITISETLGGAADATNFRNTVGLNLNNFKVGAGKVAGSNYFNHSGSTSGNQITLSLKNANNAPALGEKIYYDGYVEYSTSKAGGQWPSLKFEYTYGTVCSGYAVSATPNNSTMGTAVVKKDNEAVTNVEDGDEVSFIATVADAELYRFVNWTKGGVEVSTNATYETTISETTNLVANFDYIRNTYCHYEILSNASAVQGKKLYMTIGSIGNGKYQIRFEGSAEAPLTSLNNANYTINWVTTEIEDGDKKMAGQDVPFTDARWSFDASGYGSATAVFGIAEDHTWEDIHVWNHNIFFNTPLGVLGYSGFPDRYHIAWTETCADPNKPVMVSASKVSEAAAAVVIAVAATDDVAVTGYHVVDVANNFNATYSPSEGQITISGLAESTEYEFTITAINYIGLESENSIVVTASTVTQVMAPTTAAPTPPARDDKWVRPVYSGAYTSILEHAFALQNWGSVTGSYASIDNDDYILYDFTNGGNAVVWGENNAGANAIVAVSGKNAGGTGNNTGIDASTMEKLHLDIWSNEASNNVEVRVNDQILARVNLTGIGWQQFDLLLSEHVENVNLSSVRWFKFTNISGANHLAFDNIYFWREPVAGDETAPSDVAASMVYSDLFTIKLSATATEENNDVTYAVMLGADQVGVGSGLSGQATEISISGMTPNTEYNFSIIASDIAGNAAEPVIVAAQTKALPAPAPAPTNRPEDVKSLYSETYPSAISSYVGRCEAWWQQPRLTVLDLDGNEALYYDNYTTPSTFGWQWDVNDKVDANGYQYLHLSVYPMQEGTIEPYAVIPNVGEYHIASQTLVAGQWNDVVISYFDKAFAPFYQLGFTNYGNLGAFLIDNVYFFRDKPLVTNVDGWATFASAENFTVPAELTVYSAAYSNEGGEDILTLSDAGKVIPAGTGVLLKGEANTEYPFSYASQADADAVAANFADNSLVGCVTRTDVSAVRAENDIFCMRRSELFDQTAFFLYEGQYVPAGKAYIALPKEPNNANNAARRVRFVINEEQVATGMESIQPSAISTEKFVENGQLFIRRGDAVYTIQGTRVR